MVYMVHPNELSFLDEHAWKKEEGLRMDENDKEMDETGKIIVWTVKMKMIMRLCLADSLWTNCIVNSNSLMNTSAQWKIVVLTKINNLSNSN